MYSKILIFLTIIQFVRSVPLDVSFKEKTFWIDQKLDHFNDSETRTWKMRYIASDEYFKPGGPLFINVGGEWEISSDAVLIGFFYEIVKIFNGYEANTEHRYYGLSRPVPDMSVENLQYLSVKQALADLAHFIRYKKATVPGLANSKVILFGCSYAATMVIYFKREYPDLADGIWAAGGPVHYRLDYSDGYVSIGRSIRKACGDAAYDRIANYTSKFSKLEKNNNSRTLSELKSLDLYDPFVKLPDIIATHVQHRNLTKLQSICRDMMAIGNDDLIGFGKFLKIQQSKIPGFVDGENNTSFTETGMDRQWLYQTCNEFANFRSTSSCHQPFGDRSPFTKEIEKCKTHFGPKYTIDYINARMEETNTYFGSYEPGITHAYYTFSELDPWRLTGIHDERATILPDIGHCHEFRERTKKDGPETVAAKQRGLDLIRSWINGE